AEAGRGAPGASPVPRALLPAGWGQKDPGNAGRQMRGAISPAPYRKRKTRMPSACAAMMKKVVRKGALELTSASGETQSFGDGSESTIAIRFADAEAEAAAATDPALKLGEMYMQGRLILVEGDIFDFLSLL